MAIRIELDRTYLDRAIEQSIASLKRAEGKGLNKMMSELIRQDIAVFEKARNTMTEIK